MWRKLKILGRFELRQTWDDKMVLFYTLLCPTIYFVIADISSYGQPLGTKNVAFQLLGYWAYIILVGVLNGFQFGLIGMRESNFLKMFTIIAGDKRLIFYSNLLVQILFVQIEILAFDVVVLILNPSAWQLVPMMVGGFLLNFILIPIVAGFTNFVLMLPIRVNLASLVMMGYIFLAMVIINLPYQQDSWLGVVLAIINPGSYMIQFYTSGLNLLGQATLMNAVLLVLVAGKTTLLDFISGVSEQKGLPFHGFPPMTQVAYQMQGAPFSGSATVLESLQMMVALDQPDATLEMAQLPASLQAINQTHFRDLSGGQRRLVILTGICQLQRELYLFDEPESGLDVKVTTDVMDRIAQLAARGKTVIMTTHQFRHLPTENVRVLVLTSRGIGFSGTPAELMAATQTTTLEDAYLATDA